MNTTNANASVFELLIRDETPTGECKCCERNADKYRQLETQVRELREALDDVCFHYKNTREAGGYLEVESASIREARAILEKTK